MRRCQTFAFAVGSIVVLLATSAPAQQTGTNAASATLARPTVSPEMVGESVPATDGADLTDAPLAVQPVSTVVEGVDLSGLDAGCPSCNCPSCGGEKGGCPKCDCKKMQALNKAVAGAHKPLFYDNKFDYLCDPCYGDWWPGDNFKRMCIGPWMTLDVGGQYRARMMNERHIRGVVPGVGPGLTGLNDDFLLQRTRVYANAEVGDRFRAYVEYIDAESNYENFPPRSIEVNRSDLLNAFGDLKLYDGDGGDLWVRAGRQELLYGNQRTISPLDWANTRRTFEGYKAFYKGQDWDVDAFYTRPVFPNAKKFDSPDLDQEFMGLYSTYKGRKDRTYDFYYMRYNNGDAGFQFDTLGARWQGLQDEWLWECEGAFQFGDNADGSGHSAGFWVTGLGRKFDCCTWKPTLWAYYDWASGDDSRGAGNGYHHLFPLAHKYLGFMDLFGRRNIESPNVQLTMQPHEKVKLLFWYYYFFLQNSNDTPYNVVMAPYNPANAPASSDLGHEIDMTVAYAINARTSILFGYSHFFAGDYYKLTPGVPFRGDADFYYTEFTFNF